MLTFLTGVFILIANIGVLYVLHLLGWFVPYITVICIILSAYMLLITGLFIWDKGHKDSYIIYKFKCEVATVFIGLIFLISIILIYKRFF